MNQKQTSNRQHRMEDKDIMDDLRLINLADVPPEKIDFLWEPYIAYRKITIVQGDPGEGKTTMMLAIAAALTRGESISGTGIKYAPANVIFQSAEDGLGDTIKPRLAQLGADCKRVDVIDEDEKALSIIDERIERAMTQTGAKLLILDPIQGYLGGKEMNTANSIRPMMKRLATVAENTGAAVVLIGHLNKNTDSKSLYRGLGSIDIPAAARSVLTVGRLARIDENTRAFIQTKSNLAPTGKPQSFALDPASGFRWLGDCEVTIKELLDGKAPDDKGGASQLALAQSFIRGMLACGDVPASSIFAKAEEAGFPSATMKRAKAELGIKSEKRGSEWFWVPEQYQGNQKMQGYHQATVSNAADTVDTLPVNEQKTQEHQEIQATDAVECSATETLDTDDTDDTLEALDTVDTLDTLLPDGSNNLADDTQEPQDTQIISVGVLASGNSSGNKRKRRRRRRHNNNRAAGSYAPTAAAAKEV